MPDEIVMDLTSEEAKALEPKQVVVGDDEEIQALQDFYDKDLLSSDETLTTSVEKVPPEAAPTVPKSSDLPEMVEIDGVQVPLKDLVNIHKFKSANDIRAGQIAAERRDFEARKLAWDAERQTTEQRILNLIDQRIPAPPAAPPKPVEIDLSDVPDVDFSTFEGQERAKEFIISVAQRAATAAREEAKQALASPPVPVVTPVSSISETPSISVTDYNTSIGKQFLSPEVLGEFGFDQDKGLSYLKKMDSEFSPASSDGRWTLNEVRVLARRFQDMEKDAARVATEIDARAKLEAIKRAQDGSSVLRGGGAPAVRGLTFSQVSKMSDTDLRKLIGPMKGRGGPKGMGVEVVDKIMHAMEDAGMDVSPR